MHCKRCDYPLWSVRSRNCPECGTAFRPSDYAFVPSSVRFRCPDCDQDYFGTDAKGHLEPPVFDCVKCGKRLDIDVMVLTPLSDEGEAEAVVENLPWLERKRIGFFRGWGRTVWLGMVSPGRLIRMTPPDSSALEALWFPVLTGVIACAISGVGPILLIALTGSLMGMFAQLAILAIVLLWTAVVAILWCALIHVLLVMTGRRAHGLRRTFQVTCYSAAPMAFAIIPCVGFYVMPVAAAWWWIGAVLMLREGQKISGGRATLAVSALPLTLMLAAGLYVTHWLIPMAQQFGTVTMQSVAPHAARRDQVSAALLGYPLNHQGQWPGHGSQLISDGNLAAGDLLDAQVQALDQIPVAGTDLLTFSQMSPGEQAAVAQEAADGLPADVVAHRLGDCVFTYHGLSPSGADPGLWIAVLIPSAGPGQSPAGAAPVPVVSIAQADGSRQEIPASVLPAMLAEQNELRSTQGLPPLPDPRTVTHEQPAVAPPP